MLETKIAGPNMNAVSAGLNLHSWNFVSNINSSSTCRILVGWDPTVFSLSCMNYSDQWVTCEVTTLSTNECFKITVVYGLNTPVGRKLLWEYMLHQAPAFASTPWALMGDFNAILKPSDRSGGDMNWYDHYHEFSNCIQDTELIQVPFTGPKFSWHNGQQ